MCFGASENNPNLKGPFAKEYMENIKKYRSPNKRIDKDTFNSFFPLTGLWGDSMFKRFDVVVSHDIDQYEFIVGLSKCVKVSVDQKIKYLFDIYDISGNKQIGKQDLLTMLYNYPKEHLKDLTSDKIFLETYQLNKVKIDYATNKSFGLSFQESRLHFNSVYQSQLGDYKNPSKEEKKNQSEIEINFVDDVPVDDIPQEKNIKDDINIESFSKKSNNKNTSVNKIENYEIQEKQEKQEKTLQSEMRKLVREKSFLEDDLKIFNKKDQVFRHANVPAKAANINNVIKQYVNFILKDQEYFNFNNFFDFCIEHPQIIKIFTEAFYEKIWGEENKIMNFSKIQIDISGNIYKKSIKKNNYFKCYCELRDNFFFYYHEFNPKANKLPYKIYCLNGLNVQIKDKQEDYDGKKLFGFEIVHKNSAYKQKNFYFEDLMTRKKWLDCLVNFQKGSVNDFYQFQQKIGSGKYSIVYKGVEKNTTPPKEYAIKVIEKGKLTEDEIHFLANETEIFKFLNHPGIIKVHETHENRTHIYIIAELVKDGDLFDYVVKKEFLEEYEASLIMKQLFDTVRYIHQSGLVHRDLKPENIMILLKDQTTEEYKNSNSEEKDFIKQIKIIDFGYSTIVKQNQILFEKCGTPNYMAPEMLDDRNYGYNYLVDNFSLGCIMFFMLRGSLPFDSYDPDDIYKNTVQCVYSLKDEHWDNISDEAKDLISQLLEKEPSQRIDLDMALKHPWIKDRNNLIQYMHKNKKGIWQEQE